MTSLLVPTRRMERWIENFTTRHGATTLATSGGALTGTADDGSTFEANPPFGRQYGDTADVGSFLAACSPPERWGVLLVRKGGFAVAALRGGEVVASKVGQRHVQGRTKAGGQSQQRFARRRDNQAREAYRAAADHAARILEGLRTVVVGGDHAAVDEVLADPRLRSLAPVEPWLPVPDPRRRVLDAAIEDACSVRMTVVNT